MAKPLDRSDFPCCASCPYAQHGPWHVCVACAGETLQSIQNPCPTCSQEIGQDECFNSLCTGRAGRRHIERIEAIALHTDPFDRVIRRFKYGEKYGWALVFARLLLGHLNNCWREDDVDLIVANPGHPGRKHNAEVIRRAALQDFQDTWPKGSRMRARPLFMTKETAMSMRSRPGSRSRSIRRRSNRPSAEPSNNTGAGPPRPATPAGT